MPAPGQLRVAFVPGVTLRKWTGRWAERRADLPLVVVPVATSAETIELLASGDADLALVRLPIESDGLSVIRLYAEQPVVVVSRDDPAAEDESLAADELGDVVRSPSSAKDAIELVAAGVGRVLLPHSVARLHTRKDVVAIPVIGEPPTEIALVWPADRTTQDTEEFVGIVRGRTAASSRTTPTPPTKKPRRESVARPARKPQRRTGGKRRQGR